MQIKECGWRCRAPAGASSCEVFLDGLLKGHEKILKSTDPVHDPVHVTPFTWHLKKVNEVLKPLTKKIVVYDIVG